MLPAHRKAHLRIWTLLAVVVPLILVAAAFFKPVPLDRVDLRTIPMSMTINGVEVSTGSGGACLGHPLNSARWLADTLCARGIPLRAGDVLMTGALGPMQPMAAGVTVVADMGDLGVVTTFLEENPS